MLFESLASRYTRQQDIAQKLHDSTAKDLSDGDKKGLAEYVNGSYPLNTALIKGEKLLPRDQRAHETIMRVAKPLGHKVSLYSGSHVDFSKLAKKSKDGILHSPAHLSTTHSIHTAKAFATPETGTGNRHMIAIHIKPEDKGIHVSETPGVGLKTERETIIPSGTKLKYSHSTVKQMPRKVGSSFKDEIHVHHFTIHSQE